MIRVAVLLENTFFLEHVYLIFAHDYFRCIVHLIIFSPGGDDAMVRVSVAPRGPGVVTRLGPLMPGLVMSCCAIQTPAQALSSQGTPGTFYHRECHCTM